MRMIGSAVLLLASAAYGQVHSSPFGRMPDGTMIEKYTLTDGVDEASIMTYGARVVTLKVPDRQGKLDDIVLGYDDLAGYLKEPDAFFGAVVGRYGNRIAHGRFTLDGHAYQLPKNNGENSLHGGTVGFDRRVWTAHVIDNGVEMTLVSRDGDQGYPGTLTAHVRYALKNHALRIDYSATTDKPTVVNLTNHSYFNLNGQGHGTILKEIAEIPADSYTPVDAGLIPTGIAPVEGTPFDFRKPTAIGSRIRENVAQLKFGMGYDHNWVLRGANGTMKKAVTISDPESGRVLTVTTTQPGLQFYTGNAIPGPIRGKGGAVYTTNSALCLETQHYPDSPNHPAFPTTVLRPGETMRSTTIFTFSTQ